MGCRILKHGGNTRVNKELAGEPLAEDQVLDLWTWILRARAAARQAIAEAVTPPAAVPDIDAERPDSGAK
jgi:hypothetical protein